MSNPLAESLPPHIPAAKRGSKARRQHSAAWFSVDRDGLREIHAGLPLERMVTELVSNCWDEKVSLCEIEMQRAITFGGRPASRLVVRDNSPTGFSDMGHAFTLFKSTSKRATADVRGRFNLGEKLVIARSVYAKISSTKGTVIFSDRGRVETQDCRETGSEVEVIMPPWTEEEFQKAVAFLRLVIPPALSRTLLNGEELVARVPVVSAEAVMPTELLHSDGGVTKVTRSRRKTMIDYYEVTGRKAMLLEMGIPVTEIEGRFDIDVAQKVPLSQDRTTVAISYLQDVYAEALLALGDRIKADDVGMSTIQMALQDDRISPQKAKDVFHQVFGENAVIQSHRPDEDQEAARQGKTIVSPRTFGSDVNLKLRVAGVQTTHQLFSRDLAEKRQTESIRYLHAHEITGPMTNFIDYVKMLASELYRDFEFSVSLARWDDGQAIALNIARSQLVFHVDRCNVTRAVEDCTSIILHELAHAKGHGHDGVYDNEFERLTNQTVNLALNRPELFVPFRSAV